MLLSQLLESYTSGGDRVIWAATPATQVSEPALVTLPLTDTRKQGMEVNICWQLAHKQWQILQENSSSCPAVPTVIHGYSCHVTQVRDAPASHFEMGKQDMRPMSGLG